MPRRAAVRSACSFSRSCAFRWAAKSTPAVLAAVLSLVGVLALEGCAKSPTVVMTQISVDDTVPPILQLRTTLSLDSDPSNVASNMFSSLFHGDAADRPAPYRFPMLIQVAAPPDWSGPATIVVEGLDWDTNKVNATGTAAAQVNAGQVSQAALTLTGVIIVDTDGGVDADVDAIDVDAAVVDDAGTTDDVAADDAAI